MKARKLLIYFAKEFDGDWTEIYKEFKFERGKITEEMEREVDKIEDQAITLIDVDYPTKFKMVSEPPFALFYDGDKEILNSKKMLSFVGVEDASDYGKTMARYLLDNMDKDLTVATLFTKGIGEEVINTALDKGCKVIAIANSGLNKVENETLYNRIIENGGLILSEYPENILSSKDKKSMSARLLCLGEGLVVIDCGKSNQEKLAEYAINYALQADMNVGLVPFPVNVENKNNKRIEDGGAIVYDKKSCMNLIDSLQNIQVNEEEMEME